MREFKNNLENLASDLKSRCAIVRRDVNSYDKACAKPDAKNSRRETLHKIRQDLKEQVQDVWTDGLILVCCAQF